jgi:hypothetical protein
MWTRYDNRASVWGAGMVPTSRLDNVFRRFVGSNWIGLLAMRLSLALGPLIALSCITALAVAQPARDPNDDAGVEDAGVADEDAGAASPNASGAGAASADAAAAAGAGGGQSGVAGAGGQGGGTSAQLLRDYYDEGNSCSTVRPAASVHPGANWLFGLVLGASVLRWRRRR